MRRSAGCLLASYLAPLRPLPRPIRRPLPAPQLWATPPLVRPPFPAAWAVLARGFGATIPGEGERQPSRAGGSGSGSGSGSGDGDAGGGPDKRSNGSGGSRSTRKKQPPAAAEDKSPSKIRLRHLAPPGLQRPNKKRENRNVSGYLTPKVFMKHLKKAKNLWKIKGILNSIDVMGQENPSLAVDVFHLTAAMTTMNRRGRTADALDIFQNGFAKYGVEPNAFSYSAAITACEKERQWELALELFDEMQHRGVSPDVVTYSSVISACEKCGQWQHALDLFDELERKGAEGMPSSARWSNAADVILYSATISACEKGGQWKRAVELLRQMEDVGLVPNVVTYSAAISACGNGHEWGQAMALFDEMKKRGVGPNVITYSAAISACERIGEWQRALALFHEMKEQGLSPNVITYSTTISACGKGGQWQVALLLFYDMRKRGLEPNRLTYSATLQWLPVTEIGTMREIVARAIEDGVYSFVWWDQTGQTDQTGGKDFSERPSDLAPGPATMTVDLHECNVGEARALIHHILQQVSGWGVYCYDFLLLPITSYYS